MLRYPLNQGGKSAEQIADITRGLFLLGRMDELQPVVNWLREESIKIAKASCSELDDKRMRQMQGGHLLLEEIFEKIDKSRETRERMTGGNRGAA